MRPRWTMFIFMLAFFWTAGGGWLWIAVADTCQLANGALRCHAENWPLIIASVVGALSLMLVPTWQQWTGMNTRMDADGASQPALGGGSTTICWRDVDMAEPAGHGVKIRAGRRAMIINPQQFEDPESVMAVLLGHLDTASKRVSPQR